MESVSITSSLGIDWKLLISQAVNFLLLLIILKIFVYQPLLNILKKRQEKIAEGISKAEEASVRLKEVDEISKKKIKQAEGQAINIINETEERSKKFETELLIKAREKEAQELNKIKNRLESERQEAMQKLENQSVEIIKEALVKTIELDPKKIDEALIKKAVKKVNYI